MQSLHKQKQMQQKLQLMHKPLLEIKLLLNS
jgi:hypothetical protein